MITPWNNQKGLQKQEIPSPADIYLVCNGIPNPMVRAMFVLLYLTAGRISEVLSIRFKDLQIVERNGRQVLLIGMPNRKHKKRTFKKIPIPYDREPELLKFLIEYANTINHEDLLFPVSRGYAYKLIQTSTGFNPHWIRHIRLTHLVTTYDFNSHLLMRFAGWSDPRPAKHYVELRWTDILEKL